MRTALASFVAMLCLAGGSAAQTQEEPPPQCRYDAQGRVDYQACADASAPGTPWRMLSLINLGTQAFLQADYSTAVRHYDAAQPGDRQSFYADAMFHSFYAATLDQVGRNEEALVQARRALLVARNDPSLPPAVRQSLARMPVNWEMVYTTILPVLHAAHDPEAENVRNAYLALPAEDWVSWANRASVLQRIGDLPGALTASEQSLRLAPSEASVLNNHCYILTLMNRASDALPYCERAVQAAPQIGAVRHSHATALAALGRCDAARNAMAEARRLDPASEEYRHELACTTR